MNDVKAALTLPLSLSPIMNDGSASTALINRSANSFGSLQVTVLYVAASYLFCALRCASVIFVPLAIDISSHSFLVNRSDSINRAQTKVNTIFVSENRPKSHRKEQNRTQKSNFHTLKCKRVGERRLAKGNDMVLSNICMV